MKLHISEPLELLITETVKKGVTEVSSVNICTS